MGCETEKLIDAACAGDIDALLALLNNCWSGELDTSNSDGWTALMCAACYRHDEIGHILLEKGANPEVKNADGLTALIFAATSGTAKFVEMLLDAGAFIDSRDNRLATALMDAAAWGRIDIVNILLERGADPNLQDIDGDTAVEYALDKGETLIAEKIRQAMAK
jgi:uncharacterized protein